MAFADMQPRTATDHPLSANELEQALRDLPDWGLSDRTIRRSFEFKNHYEAIAFVNAIAWISHAEDHHPDMRVGYKTVEVAYSTHSTGGISQKDLVCAAKVSRLLR